MIERFFRAFPYLKPSNICNLYDRFIERSNGTMLFVFNIYRNRYELHSLKSFELSDESLNVVVEEDMLNGWILTDYLANNINKFGMEVASDRELHNQSIDLVSDKGLELLTTRTLKTIETMVGREI